jgi:hypothetical protein
MGLLDDAIREHLELKRRHGADLEEVARQENEALGESRRAEFARPEGAEPADAPVSAEPAAEAEAAAEPDEDFPVPEFDAGREPVAEPEDVAPPADLAAPPAPPARDDTPDDRAAPPDDLAAPTAEYQVEDVAPPAAEPFDVETDAPARPSEAGDPWLEEERDEVPADEALDHPRGADEEADEDVLEETPDFLQETPEHDRLWFEQRPPRDFDWDK